LSSADGNASPPLRRHLVNRFHAVPASEHRYGLAEGPVWDSTRNRVLWVDINAGTIHAGTLTAEGISDDTVLHVPGTAGAVVTSREGELLVAGARRLYTIASDGAVSPGAQVLSESTASRLNDGGCDPAGRFLVGSLALDDRAHEEVLVRIDADGEIVVIDDDLGLSNGLAFTPNGEQLYSVDTTAGTVWIRDYDPGTGAVGPRHEFLRVPGRHPDGLCLDDNGNLWIAMWGEGKVECYSPEGHPLAVVEVPAPNTTSVAFVGANLDTLLITTASEELSDAQLARYPDSGRLFTAQVGFRGLPVPAWRGSGSSSHGAPAPIASTGIR
jgi:sugar lactone lactonase YvrE